MDSQWPKKGKKLVTFEGSTMTVLVPFPAVSIEKLVLRNSRIFKIEMAVFKMISNLVELDLSDNQLTSENLKPDVFRVISIEKKINK